MTFVAPLDVDVDAVLEPVQAVTVSARTAVDTTTMRRGENMKTILHHTDRNHATRPTVI
jgi:hypothetical protein